MSAYWVARARVIDAAQYARYAERVPAVLATYGGRILARGGPFHILEGTDEYSRFVVVEFPSLQAARDCHASAAYQEIAAHRLGGAGKVDLIVVEGVPG